MTVRAGLANPGANTGGLRALRTLRCLRPLRLISRFESMQLVISALLRAIPGIVNVCMIMSLVWLIFRYACLSDVLSPQQVCSILGVQLFGGKFSRCVNGQMAPYSPTDVPDKATCLNTTGNVWWTPPASFDNSGLGLVALFQVASGNGWIDVIQNSIDGTGINQQVCC